MNHDSKETIEKIIIGLKNVPSTLDAIDKIGDWSYFHANKEALIKLSTLLPAEIKAQTPNFEHVSPVNWKDQLKIVQKILKKL